MNNMMCGVLSSHVGIDDREIYNLQLMVARDENYQRKVVRFARENMVRETLHSDPTTATGAVDGP